MMSSAHASFGLESGRQAPLHHPPVDVHAVLQKGVEVGHRFKRNDPVHKPEDREILGYRNRLQEQVTGFR